MQFKNTKAIFQQISDKVLFDLVEGKLNAGDRIASVRDFAADIEVNPNTVMRAYTWLSDEGVIVNNRGIGYFIADDAVQKAKELLAADFKANLLPEFLYLVKLLDINTAEILNQK